MNTVCVGSVILILVTSTYGREYSVRYFFVSLDNSDYYVTIITLAALISLWYYYVARA